LSAAESIPDTQAGPTDRVVPAARPSKSERTRRLILASAERHFATLGFEKTRLEDVADDIGMVGSAILYHYGDKRELYRAVLDDLVAGLLESVDAAVEAASSPSRRLEGLVRASVRVIAARPALASIVLRESMSDDPDLQRRSAPFIERFVRHFEEGARTGAIHPVRSDPYHFISAVSGAVLFYVAALPRLVPERPNDHLAPDRMDALEGDAIEITRRLLGLTEPQSI